jgi:hypothetical protein
MSSKNVFFAPDPRIDEIYRPETIFHVGTLTAKQANELALEISPYARWIKVSAHVSGLNAYNS